MLGTIIAVLIALVSTFTAIVGGGDYYNGDNPWNQNVPPSAEHVAGSSVWSGEGGVLIPLNREEFGDSALSITLTQGALVELYVSRAEDVGDPTYPYPEYLEILRPNDRSVLIPTGDLTELWAMGNGAWELTMVPLEASEITSSYDGKGDMYLIYRGDALSAQVSHKGGGIFFVTVYSVNGRDMPIIESGEVDTRMSWGPSTYTIFFIESNADRGAWSIEIEELAKNVPTPSNSPEPSPSPTP